MTVTKNIKPYIYACIVMVPSGNLNGSQNVFGIYTDRIFKLMTIKEFSISERVVRIMNDWGNNSNIKEY